ncbi:MAG: ribbon-helix-helix protein, CopG family [Bryobacteraceae bacterium]
MTNANVLLPDELLHQVEETARNQNRKTAEVLEEAVRQYLDNRKWEGLVEAGERRAKEKGLTEVDILRLIEEVRREIRTCEP